MAGFNWFLIVVTVVVAALAVLTALYLLVHYMHPEDKNQAWFPKVVVITGITLAIWTVLLFPLDAANRKACSPDVPVSYCTLTIPTLQLWLACFIANAVLTFVAIPFAMFYYEADSDWTTGQRWMHALLWEAATVVTFGMILGICYALVGYVEYPVAPLSSGFSPMAALHGNSTLVDTCARPGTGPANTVYAGRLCDAINGDLTPQIWKLRCSFPVYIIAMSATAGWLLFMVFAGVGFVALPLDLIRDFIGRPKATITHSEYIKRAKGLGTRAKAIKADVPSDVVDTLKKEERAEGRTRKWRGAFRRIQQQLLDLEADSKALELVFPQASQ
ncbi:LIMR family protein At3g08930 [Coccomyxa sp. Obi]|nr:LIMR family protein At3g08930 [Coccomyxa sp. Obi]